MSVRQPSDPATALRAPDVASCAAVLQRVRDRSPLVQCLTNSVVMPFSANVLLAVGASPAMVDIPEEAGPFAQVADAVLVNVGTPYAEQRDAMVEAARSAGSHGTPWVLDPVAVGSLAVRTRLVAQLLELGPDVVRGNPSEVMAVAGTADGGRGVDSTAATEESLDAAVSLATTLGGVVAVSGAVDVVTDGDRTTRVANGHPWLTQVTGGGCALGAVVAAFRAVESDTLSATVAAVASYTVAAEVAAATASGPGSFASSLLDALAGLDGETLRERIVLR
ncbi:hydroxyethylthiazole kinase [Nocardioidaceae bacterium]|nr:hydroxyethylthiazole kinase [Nocardioidaceae bacterium]